MANLAEERRSKVCRRLFVLVVWSTKMNVSRLRAVVAKLQPIIRQLNILEVHFSKREEVEDVWWELAFFEDELQSILERREAISRPEPAPHFRVSNIKDGHECSTAAS